MGSFNSLQVVHPFYHKKMPIDGKAEVPDLPG